MPQTLLFLRGLPGSGKTTYARSRIDNGRTIVRVSKDDLRAMLLNEYSHFTEAIVREAEDVVIEHALRDGKTVVVDDTNINPDHIDRISSIIPHLGSAFPPTVEIETLTTPVDVYIARDAERAVPVGRKRILEMASAMEVFQSDPRWQPDTRVITPDYLEMARDMEQWRISKINSRDVPAADVVRLLRSAIDRVGSQKAFAETHGIAPQHISDVLKGRCEPNDKMVYALRLVKAVRYTRQP